MTRLITVAALQSAYSDDLDANIARTIDLIREAADAGAQVILPSELFQGPYFCVSQEERWFATAHPWRTHPCVTALAPVAAELGVVLPVSIFEREGPHYFNSLVMLDADGSALGVYRKSHIPDGPGYQEKYYFRPGDTGFRVWDTRFGRLGVGICWDQWYPECARAMALMGAEVLFYPTAIGSEPHDPTLDTAAPWRRAMQGHAVSNVIPVVGANRTGFEPWSGYPGGGQGFYGSSFIADHRGDLVADLSRDEQGVALASFDLDFLQTQQGGLGVLSRSPAGALRFLDLAAPDVTAPAVIETGRLRLRDFREDERARFAELAGDAEIGAWLGGSLARREADAAFDRVRAAIAAQGYGLWAVERLADGALIGQIGLNAVPDDLPVAPAIEMSWRMFPAVWGQGYAGEGAAAALAWGLAHLPAGAEIVAFTTRTNRRSEAIMRRIGLVRDRARDFEHPRLPQGHPLRSHIVYAARRPG